MYYFNQKKDFETNFSITWTNKTKLWENTVSINVFRGSRKVKKNAIMINDITLRKTFEIGEVFLQTKFFFNSASQYCLTVAWIQPQMLFRCYVLHINTTIMRHILHLVYLCPVLGLVLFVSNLGFIFHFQPHFHYNHVISLN